MTATIPYVYKGRLKKIENCIGLFCLSCDESIHDPTEAERISEEMVNFRILVDFGEGA